MLRKFRDKHIKIILWGLVIVIVPAFVLWGALTYFKSKKDNIVAEIGKERITVSQLAHYYRLAQIHYMLIEPREAGEEAAEKAGIEDLSAKAWDFLLFLWKAKQERIRVSNTELRFVIKLMFFPKSKFDPAIYERFVQRTFHIEPRQFEEYMRDFVKMDKLFAKELKIDVTPEQVNKLYKQDHQKAKAQYLLLPYEQFSSGIKITDQQVQQFYDNNKESFRVPATIQIKYVLLKEDDPRIDELKKAVGNNTTLADLLKKYTFDVKVSDYITMTDPIEGIGFQQELNRIAFSLPTAQVTPPLETNTGYVLLEKSGERASSIPSLQDVSDQIKAILTDQQIKAVAQDKGEQLIKTIKDQKIEDWQQFAKQQNARFEETDFFGYRDFIFGMGLNLEVNEVAFSLEPGQVYDKPLLLQKGVYIVKLKEFTPFNEEEYNKIKDQYYSDLYQQQVLIEKLKLRTDIEREGNLRIYQTFDLGQAGQKSDNQEPAKPETP